MARTTAYIGLGSNLEDPIAQVRRAVRELGGLPGVRLYGASSLYRSPPMGGSPQPDYINAAVRVETDLGPEQLLHAMQQLERRHGREAVHERWAARTLDLDLLMWGRECRSDAALTLPHPGLHERAFVLAPLQELDAELEVPGRGAVAQLLQQCAYAQVDRIGSCYRLPEALRLIAVEGPMGVGKTTLCNRLAAEFDGQLMLERYRDNPFLERFFEHPEESALPVQLHFLNSRMRQLRQLQQTELFRQRVFADFMLEKSDWFSQLALRTDEYDLWLSLYAHMSAGLPRPDLVICLQAPVPVLMERIAARGRPYERAVRPEFLERLSAQMVNYFREYQGALLTVDAAHADLAYSRQDYQCLLAALEELELPGRYFLDPAQPGSVLSGAPAELALS